MAAMQIAAPHPATMVVMPPQQSPPQQSPQQPQMQPQMQMLPQMPPQMQQQLYSAQQVQAVQHVQQLHSAGRQPVPVQIASPLPAQQPMAQPRPAGLRGAAVCAADTTAFSRVEAAPSRPVAAAGQAAAAGAASGAAVPLPAASPPVGVERGARRFPEGAVVEGLATLTSDMSDEVKSAALSW